MKEHKLQLSLMQSITSIRSVSTSTNITNETERAFYAQYPANSALQQNTSIAVKDAWAVSDSVDVIFLLKSIHSYNALEHTYKNILFSNQFTERYYNGISSLASLRATPRPNSQFHFSLGYHYRPPSLHELSATKDLYPGILLLPNPDLKGEYSLSLNTAYAVHHNNIHLTVGGYSRRIQRYILLNTFNPSPATTSSRIYEQDYHTVRFQNMNSAILMGGNVEAEWFFKPLWKLSWKATYSYGINQEDGSPLPNIPPFYTRLALSQNKKIFRHSLYALLNGWKRDNRYAPLSFQELGQYATPLGMPAWFTLNYTIEVKPNERVTFLGSVKNILDMHYRGYASGINGPGRNFILSVKYAF
jgi:hemoglobin/transferrin/lactoferrin receptor protein